MVGLVPIIVNTIMFFHIIILEFPIEFHSLVDE
jgi:hypothetical protein